MMTAMIGIVGTGTTIDDRGRVCLLTCLFVYDGFSKITFCINGSVHGTSVPVIHHQIIMFSGRLISLVLAMTSATFAAAPAQLCSTPDTFDIDIFGTYPNDTPVTAGEPLVVAWLRPTTSTVRAVKRLSFVNETGGSIPLRKVGSLPSFSRKKGGDRAGGILVKPFVSTPPGTYVVRLSLDVPRNNCYIDTEAFELAASALSCDRGQVECTSGQAFRRCGEDGWDREELCPVDKVCQDGRCI